MAAGYEVIETLGVVQDTKKFRTQLDLIRFFKSGDSAMVLNRTITGYDEPRRTAMVLDMATGYALMNALESYFRG